jgi:hypothetical protein
MLAGTVLGLGFFGMLGERGSCPRKAASASLLSVTCGVVVVIPSPPALLVRAAAGAVCFVAGIGASDAMNVCLANETPTQGVAGPSAGAAVASNVSVDSVSPSVVSRPERAAPESPNVSTRRVPIAPEQARPEPAAHISGERVHVPVTAEEVQHAERVLNALRKLDDYNPYIGTNISATEFAGVLQLQGEVQTRLREIDRQVAAGTISPSDAPARRLEAQEAVGNQMIALLGEDRTQILIEEMVKWGPEVQIMLNRLAQEKLAEADAADMDPVGR